jgi:methylthioribose-1-phosphate isomerase
MMKGSITQSKTSGFSDDGDSVMIIDQSLLPNETEYLELRQAPELYEPSISFECGGRPIGIFAAYA